MNVCNSRQLELNYEAMYEYEHLTYKDTCLAGKEQIKYTKLRKTKK
jgi:hypothetical protein